MQLQIWFHYMETKLKLHKEVMHQHKSISREFIKTQILLMIVAIMLPLKIMLLLVLMILVQVLKDAIFS